MSSRSSDLFSINYENPPLLVNRSDVASFKPAVYERFGAGFDISQVSAHEAWPAHTDFASFAWFLDRKAKLVD